MKSKISALMDGELDSEDVAGMIAQLKKTDGLRDEWATYHLIGDALRQSTASIDITQRVSAELAAEPTILAPQPPVGHKFKVFALSAAASVATVAVVGWMSLQNMDRPQENLASNITTTRTMLDRQLPVLFLSQSQAQSQPLLTLMTICWHTGNFQLLRQCMA
jgi:sigma-E factor negative regulatory protein RseA